MYVWINFFVENLFVYLLNIVKNMVMLWLKINPNSC